MIVRLASNTLRGLRIHEQCHDQAVQTQDFGENEDEDHADEETGLLGGAADTGVADDADGEAEMECQ